MPHLNISIDIRLTKEFDGKSQEVAQANFWRSLRQLGQACYQIALAGLLHLLTRYQNYRNEKHKAFMGQWPPHSLFCECRHCQKSVRAYTRELRRGLIWGRDGHIIETKG